jgi:AraC-like DNA-binding protein
MDFLISVLHNLIMAGDDLTFLHSAHFPRCAARLDKRFEGYHSLQFMASGEVDLFYDRQRHALRGRWFWPAYPGPRIRFFAAAGCSTWSHRYVAFAGPLVGRWASEGLMPRGPQPGEGRVPWAEWFDDLLNRTRRTGRWATLAAVNRLERILIELAQSRISDPVEEPWLEELLKKVDAGEIFDAEVFAADHGMALVTLRRRFREKTGIALHTYVIQSRMAGARRMLSEGDLPIKAVAQKLGYRDVYFFSRQFHQQTGLPPAAFRRARQEKGGV